jgi:hypothetical protein
MTTPKNGALELLQRIDMLGDSIPQEPADVDGLLAEAGIDVAQEIERSMSLVAQAKAQAISARFAEARRERIATTAALKGPERPKRSRAENLNVIALIAARVPAGRELVVQHRGFEAAPDEDVDSLAAELELLTERHGIGKK